MEGASSASRKKLLVRPERARIDEDHPQYHYNVAAQHSNYINVQPSTTGNDPNLTQTNNAQDVSNMIPLQDISPPATRDDCSHDDVIEHNHYNSRNDKINEISTTEIHDNYHDNYNDAYVVDGLNDEINQNNHRQSGSSSHSFREAFENTLTNNPHENPYGPHEMVAEPHPDLNQPLSKKSKRFWKRGKTPKVPQKGPPLSLWRFYCILLTFWIPPFVMRWLGMPTKDRQMAWREKIGLITVIIYIAAFVAYLTFGFTRTVCHSNSIRIHISEVNSGSLVIHGNAYDLTRSTHPEAQGIPPNSNILYPPVNAGGQDASFLFQNVNGHCKGLLTPRDNSSIPTDNTDLAWYMPCKLYTLDGSTETNLTTDYYNGWACHTSSVARRAYWDLKVTAQVYFAWDDIKNSSRNLVVFNGNVIDLNLIDWIQTDSVIVPQRVYDIRDDPSIKGLDVSTIMGSGQDRQILRCLSDIAKVGWVDAEDIGCIASKVVLYVSLVFIISIVAIKFFFALYFRWFISGRQGANYMSNKELAKRDNAVEDWSKNSYAQGPVKRVRRTNNANPKSRRSVFGKSFNNPYSNITMASQNPFSTFSKVTGHSSLYMDGTTSRNSLMPFSDDMYQTESLDHDAKVLVSGDTSYQGYTGETERYYSTDLLDNLPDNDIPDVNSPDYVVPQPPVDYQPFGFPLAHTMCLVTAYSESIDGLRTTLDSIATTDYPNSHKMILVICDGLIKGAGNDLSTPEIALSMMKDFAEPYEQVQPYSYVSVVSGSKRHNMAKVYAGFYKYDNNTMDPSKQQRVPMITIVKCGTPDEASAPKPGNRGKRDSQIILMSFLQRVMFDERMTELDYELFNGIWKVTGIAPDFYEIVLMVDADTKVFPDSLTHMVACMVKDPEIMGLCGETKISNKRSSWVSMIQVFEYYISHHQSKAFESCFGGVTCLPGCFCMYRIKAPKGDEGYWVPILCNPDIVERYAENVVDTLHKRNLLLLGEDRYLTSLMLRTFPKRKQLFVPKAVCKTVVPEEFKVLLSQRRRWINSTVHNLMELVLVRDLCGVFCISMQFVVFVELVGTLVLPAAISFTLYVVIISIISKPTPVLSLVLLALILGLPGLLIVVTATRLSYIVWMLIYLLSLPIWNFVLPVYAYWKFDDFSWGDTRTIAGGDKGGHDDGDGEFDSTKIIMKRWRDFEREKHRFVHTGNSGLPYAGHHGFANTDAASSVYLHNPGSSSYAPSMSSSYPITSGLVSGAAMTTGPLIPANHFNTLAEQRANAANQPPTNAWMEAVGEAGSELPGEFSKTAETIACGQSKKDSTFASHNSSSIKNKSQTSLNISTQEVGGLRGPDGKKISKKPSPLSQSQLQESTTDSDNDTKSSSSSYIESYLEAEESHPTGGAEPTKQKALR